MNYFIFFLIFYFSVLELNSQNPVFFHYEEENGLPSNEVYSIIQDSKGFIWIGSDLGLYKFDGIRFNLYRCKTQKSKSISNLTLSNSGVIFCTNFENQIFFIDSLNQLQELRHNLQEITNISISSNDILYVTHSHGISYFNLKSCLWKHIKDFENEIGFFTRSVITNDKNEIYFLSSISIRKISEKKSIPITNYKFRDNIAAFYLIAYYEQKIWLFSRINHSYYTIEKGKVTHCPSNKLYNALKNKKITRAKVLNDNKLWISTYQGTIIYDEKMDSVQTIYSEFSFSDVILDREGNYWFTSLEKGVFRVPNLKYLVWNEMNENINNHKIKKLATDSSNLYFADAGSSIGQIHLKNQNLRVYKMQIKADIENLSYDFNSKKLYFCLKNSIYCLKNYIVQKEPIEFGALKSFLHLPPYYFLGSSSGLFIKDSLKTLKINDYWCREIVMESKNSIWIATNQGILNFLLINNHWVCNDTLQKNTQILSVDYDAYYSHLFFVTFDGKIYLYSTTKKKQKFLFEISEKSKAHKIRIHRDKIYLAYNQGVIIYDYHAMKFITHLQGLISNNVHDLLIIKNDLWLATGKGLQKIPINSLKPVSLAKIYLRTNFQKKSLDYNEILTIYPEVVSYSSNGNFQFAYQIENQEWIKLPSSIEKIELQNLPYGLCTLKIKSIDHLQRDSENIILIKVQVRPPFWATWWFRVSIFTLLSIAFYWVTSKIIRTIENRKNTQIELLNSQLKAIRAQMNPHFLYNTLNSIQDLILQKDIKNTNYFLSKFSNLMRQILSFSEQESILFADEIDMLQNYLELEKLRFGDDFHFEIHIDKNIDIHEIYIPSLMIQPNVENAIKHGLLHKKGNKYLRIQFFKSNKEIIITIEDNGIGRKKSREIQQRSGFKHKSFASQALQKRMELLSKSHDKKIQVEIQDIYRYSEVAGTRVIIKIEEYL